MISNRSTYVVVQGEKLLKHTNNVKWVASHWVESCIWVWSKEMGMVKFH